MKIVARYALGVVMTAAMALALGVVVKALWTLFLLGWNLIN